MGFSFNYRCDRCRRRLSTSDSDDSCYYVLPDGREFPLATADAWCDRCRYFVHAENSPAFHYNVESIVECHHATEQGELPAQSPEHADWLAAMLEWRKLRKSGPKCLSCGSANILYLHVRGEHPNVELLHPRCGGKLGREGEAEHSILCEVRILRFGVEGPDPAPISLRNRLRFAQARFIDWLYRTLIVKRSPNRNEPRVGDLLKADRRS